jgi:hypothetical protein
MKVTIEELIVRLKRHQRVANGAALNISVNLQDIVEVEGVTVFHGPDRSKFGIDLELPGYVLDVAEARYVPVKRYNPRKVTGERTNAERVRCATNALSHHQFTRKVAVVADDREMLIDLLADVLHWCDANKIDFNTALETAATHHGEEK